MLLAALPMPKESRWIKDIDEWFYLTYGGSPIRLQWAIRTSKPRSLSLYDNALHRKTAVAATTHEVNSALVPMLGRYNISEDAVTDMILAAADYFSRDNKDDKIGAYFLPACTPSSILPVAMYRSTIPTLEGEISISASGGSEREGRFSGSGSNRSSILSGTTPPKRSIRPSTLAFNMM